MPEYSRLESRRQRRRGPNSATIGVIVAAVVAVGLLAAGAVWWAGTHRGGNASVSAITTVGGNTGATGTTSPASASVAKPSAAASVAAPAAEASSTTSAATQAAAEASVKATKKAAVPYPGAPALSATTPSINHLKPRHKYIAITLDDGYNFQPKLLELFQQYDVRCTTFLIGSWAASHKKEVGMMHDAGFEIANHTWSHPFLTKLSSSQIASELNRTQKVLTSVTGNQAPYLRPPFGGTNASVKAAAAKQGYRIVMWDRTFGDSGRGATPKKLYSNVMYSGGGVKPGDIILCHWGSKPSYEALKKILPELQAQGYEFVTVSELIADSK